MKIKSSFIKFIQISVVFLFIILSCFFIIFDIIQSYRDFQSHANTMRANYIEQQKNIIKREVLRVIEMMEYEKSLIETKTRELIKSRVYEAYAIAYNIYKENKGKKPDSEIQKMIRDALREIRFANGTGYYFAARLDGVEMLFADHPELEGINMLNTRDSTGAYVVKDLIKIVREKGEGFYEYLWTKPEAEGNSHKKYSFVKLFEPYNWYIGTGLYIEDMENDIKNELLKRSSNIRFGKEGYIFINKLDGTALISNGKILEGNKKLWEEFPENREKTKGIFDKEYTAATKSGGDFIYYTWEKLTNPEKESPKVSFVYGFPAFQWLVGAGVYLDDVEDEIAVLKKELNSQIRSKILFSIIIFFVIILFFLFIFIELNKEIKKDFNIFVKFFNNVTYSDQKIDEASIQFSEFKLLATDANKMLEDKLLAQEEKQQMENEIQKSRKLESVGILAGGIAHDFNNILTGLFGNIELAKMEISETHPSYTYLNDANNALIRAKNLTTQLLTFSKGGEPILDNIDIISVCRDVIKFNLAGSSIKTVYEIRENLWNVIADKGQISQVISNITVNAKHAMPDGGAFFIKMENLTDEQEKKRFNISSDDKNTDFVKISMRDEGIGISPDLIDKIFDPFFTTKPHGNGLGLSTVYSIIAKHNGFITVNSTPGIGTEFIIYLPAETKTVEKKTINSDNEKKKEFPCYSILMMDDEELIRSVAGKMLMKLGHKVEFAENGSEAIRMYTDKRNKRDPYDLVIMDLTIPGGMGGKEAVNKILEIDEKAIVIVASGYSTDSAVADYRLYGFKGRLTKPFHLDELKNEIQKVMKENTMI